MEGGGVGANYSSVYLKNYQINTPIRVHIVCSEDHPNFTALDEAGLISPAYLMDDADLSVPDTREGWAHTLSWIIDRATQNHYNDALEVVIDVSQVRASGLPIKTFGGTSAGPAPLAKLLKEAGHLLTEMYTVGVSPRLVMELDHAIATCVVSGNVRRSARMSIMRWDDPEIEWFIRCKEDGLGHWSTNLSVEIDDEFVSYVTGNQDSDDGADPRGNLARRVYSEIISGMLRNGEPGIWNSTLANRGEPNRLLATNPCGEIGLEAWENCNLGHVNLDKFVNADGSVDYDGAAEAHRLMARFLIRATFGDITDPKTRAVVNRNRRIGVGHFGYAGFVARQGIPFSSSWKHESIQQFLAESKFIVGQTAREYAHELRIPVPVKTTTVAPTGSIALLPGVPSGFEPVFARHFIRRVRYSSIDASQESQIESYAAQGYRVVEDSDVPNTMVVEIPMEEPLVEELRRLGIDPEILESADEICLRDRLEVQKMYQTWWADNSISCTINLDPKLNTESSVGRILKDYLPYLKGTTIFPEQGYDLPPIERITEAQYLALRGSQAGFPASQGNSYDMSCTTGACPVR